MGMLTIKNAKLKLAQFTTTSDADSFRVDVSQAAFEFAASATSAPVAVSLYAGAHIKGTDSSPCIDKGVIRVRLQGVDAPELSFPPMFERYEVRKNYSAEQRDEFARFNEKGQQPLADAARKALHAELVQRSGAVADVVVTSRVNLPGDVFDTYGRFIGEVTVTQGAPPLNVNLWLIEQGWGFPAYYESMDAGEIQAIDTLTATARAAGRNVWGIFRKEIPPMTVNRRYSPAASAAAHAPALTLPKLFRRQAVWWAGAQAGLWDVGLREYLVTKGEELLLKSEYLKWGRGAPRHKMSEFISEAGVLTVEPESMVFLEKSAILLNANGKEILSWLPPNTPDKLVWSKPLLPNVNQPQAEWVNSVSISDNGAAVVGGTFRYDYAAKSRLKGDFGLYCHDRAGAELWQAHEEGWGGVFATAISGNGKVAAAGGWRDRTHGLLAAYDVAAGPNTPLLDCRTMPHRVNAVSLSTDGTILAAGADQVYLFQNTGNGFSALPGVPEMCLRGRALAAAVHPSGDWLVACSDQGEVLAAEIDRQAGTVLNPCVWPALGKPVDPREANSDIAPVGLICVALTSQTGQFAVGGGDSLFLYSKAEMLNLLAWQKKGKKPPDPPFPVEIDTWSGDAPIRKKSGGAAENVRWLCFTPDGKRLAVLLNRKISGQRRGVLQLYAGSPLALSWQVEMPRYPNCVGINPAGDRIVVAYGYPEKSQSGFCLFDGAGKEIWDFPTDDMNWPIAFSGDGTLFAAGGDDGNLYLFKP